MLDLFPVPVRLALCDLEAPGWGSHRPCWFCFCFCLCFLLFGFLPVLFGFGFFVFAFCLARRQLNGLCIDPIQFSFVSHCQDDQRFHCIGEFAQCNCPSSLISASGGSVLDEPLAWTEPDTKLPTPPMA